MKAVIGLGNPGTEYRKTRHNIGFEVVDAFAARYGAELTSSKFQSVFCSEMIGDEKVLLVKPQTFMNLSGQSVQAIMAYYNLTPSQSLIVYDDYHLDLGRVRFRPTGSAGGHNGIKSIIATLGGDVFDRMRIGIGSPGRRDVTSYVLGKFSPAETKEIELCIPEYLDMIECWLREDIELVMAHFNGTGK